MIKRTTSYWYCGVMVFFLMAIGVHGAPVFNSPSGVGAGESRGILQIPSVDLNKEPIVLAQAKEKSEEMGTAQKFYIPPKDKDTTPKAATAMLPEEDIFAQLVTLRFVNADLQNVIRMIARQTGLNVIMARNQVAGIITLDLEDVPLGSALDAILKTHGLAFVREPGGIVRIVPRAEIRATTIELKTVHIPVNWVPAEKLASTLRPFLTKVDGAQIQADGETNALIITDTPPNVDTLIALEEKLDVPEKQVMIEMRLVDMGKTFLRKIGVNWTLIQANDAISALDKDGFGSLPVPLDDFYSGQLNWGKKVSFLGEDFDFDIFAGAYENRGLIKVLANPKVITLNNIPAKIEIIEDIPYTDSVIGSGGAITVKTEFKEAGIKMEVTPNITNNGYIRMKIKPEQKIYRGRDPYIQEAPLIDKRLAETNVIIRDEETVVLGGLRQDNSNNLNSGTPWFMDIPVLGWFFKKNTIENSQLELVMFVTPHIIKEPSLTEVEKLEYQQIDTGWNLPEEFFAEKEEEK